ncbi:MAG: cell division protein ZapA [Novosphingobium sp.]
MSNVTLSIGGRSYTVACAEGEEAHVTRLGRMIDEKVSGTGASPGQTEVRQLLFASLLLADELHDARRSEPRPPTTEPPHGSPDTADPDLTAEIAPVLERFAERIENLATRLETLSDNA